ncbi:MAG: urease accessory protein UreE [Gammaproteobacteria bacterium]|nr:urease accessory protein UreE [Gammaproteobacteria bacterium]
MLKITRRLDDPVATDLYIKLSFEVRQKSRFKTQLNDGIEVGVVLSRGHILRDGDCLLAEDNQVVRIVADDETLSIVDCDDPLMLCKACYHLGNRHVALQIKKDQISYLHDHVLDDMVKGLGLSVRVEQAPFEPEDGAYASHSHSHKNSHTHSHSHHE